MKEVEDCEMLDLGPHKDIRGAQLDFLSGERTLHNLRGAEHRPKRRWCSSPRRSTAKCHVHGDDNIRKVEQQIIWQWIYSPAINEHVVAKYDWTKQSGNGHRTGHS